ncbi:MAG: YihY/virulence factor BrkB family protein [Actinomycetota bacterium]|nr:YihY/virulence factor BrkB family protein [Actinomycetota bacterium]
MSRLSAHAWLLTKRVALDSAQDRVHGLAAEGAFFALLSLPPFLLAVLGTIGYFRDLLGPDTMDEIQGLMLGVPAEFLSSDTMREFIRPSVDAILERGRGGVVSLGLVIALWSGSRATGVYIDAIAIAYDLGDPRPLWQRRLLAFALTLVAAVIGVVVLPGLVVGPRLVKLVTPAPFETAVSTAVTLVFWPMVALLAVLLLATLYHVSLPQRTPWQRDLPGAFLALGVWLLGSYGLRLYVEHSLLGQSPYGPLAAPLVVLLWLYVTAFAVLLGAELNGVIHQLWPPGAGLPILAPPVDRSRDL